MKILETAKNAIGKLRTLGVPDGIHEGDIEKRDGLYVSRPLLAANAKKWHDWAVKHGIPKPVPAEEMHITIIYSTVDVKLPMDERAITVDTRLTEYGDVGVFAMLGPDEDCLTFCFQSWTLHSRHHQFIYGGASSKWPCYRPHLTLSYGAKDFELSDEALADVPNYIVLGPEVNAEPKKRDLLVVAEDDEEDGEDEVLVIVIDLARTAAKEMIEKGLNLPLMDAAAVHDVAEGRVSRGVAKRLAAIETMPDAIKALATAEKAAPRVAGGEVRKRVEVDLEIQVRSLPEDVLKTLKTRDIAKTDDEEQIVMGIASVSTVKGELVKDLHGDFVTTQALREFNRSLISGTRAGKFDHEGEAVTEIVAGLVLSEEWQKSLGIDLGFEPYLVEIHVPDATDWAEVKKGEWMLSVAGRMWYWEEDAGNAQV